MRNLHLMSTDKFIEPYIKFINSNFSSNDHQFLCFTSKATNHIKNNYNNAVFPKGIFGKILVFKELYKADRIYLHSLFSMKIVILFFFQPWLLKKCFWIVWGGDLYAYRHHSKTIKAKTRELVRAFVVKRFSGLITPIKGDYELAKKWYGVRGKYYYSLVYPSNLYKEIAISEKTKDDNVTYIQVGNSADPTNNHLEVFEKLKNLNHDNVRIICVLSYGDKEYAEIVVKRGKEIFGDSFKPLLEFMSFAKYLDLLSKIDIAIFNHNRQQAVGNITTLLGLGKKVYIRDDITTWGFCKDLGLEVYSTNNEINSVFAPMVKEIRSKNKEIMKSQFSQEKLKEEWDLIFRN